MTEHRVLDYDTPLNPDDIDVGNIIVHQGRPRTITHVDPYHDKADHIYPHTERVLAGLGNGDGAVFYVVTCCTCGTRRAFPGLAATVAWWGVKHEGSYWVYCSWDCLVSGTLGDIEHADWKSVDNTHD